MDNFRFFPTLTEEMIERAGCSVEKYAFSYHSGGCFYELKQKGHFTLKISDPLEIWKIEKDGLKIQKTVKIAYPRFLYGKDGIVCSGAEFGICIIWTNKTLTQTGCILPSDESITPNGRICIFEHEFETGSISGDLELSVIFYVKEKTNNVLEEEQNLMNEEGVSVGVLETVVLDFDSIYMDFPIEEYSSENEPLWWVEFSEWEDPKSIETFTKDNICLYLNPHYPLCPMTDGTIKNIEILIEILAMTYYMIFNRLSEDDLVATKNDINLEPGSICSVLHQFIMDCEDDLVFEPREKLLKSLQMNIAKKFAEDSA